MHAVPNQNHPGGYGIPQQAQIAAGMNYGLLTFLFQTFKHLTCVLLSANMHGVVPNPNPEDEYLDEECDDEEESDLDITDEEDVVNDNVQRDAHNM